MENIHVQFDGMLYQQIVGIPMGTNCAPLIADLFICCERDFMSDHHKSKRYDLIDMFNDTSRYLDDIFTIDNPKIEKYIPDIYPAELQLKAKSKKYQGVCEVKSRVKTWQVRGIWSQQLEH